MQVFFLFLIIARYAHFFYTKSICDFLVCPWFLPRQWKEVDYIFLANAFNLLRGVGVIKIVLIYLSSESHWTSGWWSLAPGIGSLCIGIKPPWYSWCNRLACSILASSRLCSCRDEAAGTIFGGDCPLSPLEVSLPYHHKTTTTSNNFIKTCTYRWFLFGIMVPAIYTAIFHCLLMQFVFLINPWWRGDVHTCLWWNGDGDGDAVECSGKSIRGCAPITLARKRRRKS